MNILLGEEVLKTNQYMELIANSYQEQGHKVIFSLHNFFYSSFVPDVVHIQWPESIYKWGISLPPNAETLALVKARLAFYKQAKTKIVYTVHNIVDKKQETEFEKELFSLISGAADLLVHHGAAGRCAPRRLFQQRLCLL